MACGGCEIISKSYIYIYRGQGYQYEVKLFQFAEALGNESAIWILVAMKLKDHIQK